MTSYIVLINKKLDKSIKNLPEIQVKKFVTLIDVLTTNPFPWKDFDLKKIEGSDDTYRIRFGRYRVVYYVEKKQKTIHVLKFEIRGKAYK
ncbi:MAG: type II toxin-antitoxin system RelE/ParE family toxin [Candidatus Methanoperedens sp.]|nr:type II toxin-antitoxin system RelE/ParE family toxin [Candidatus Methanoperedens sp.]